MKIKYALPTTKSFLLIVAALFLGFNLNAQPGAWAWMHGDTIPYGNAVVGTQGVPNMANTPGGLYESAHWKDLNGNFWIFGGVMGNYEWAGMWKLDPTTNMWAWMNTSPNINLPGVYGIQGVPSTNNHPGSRGWGSATWTDHNGDLWLFGGWGTDASGQIGTLSDLWRYHIATNEWTWMSGMTSIYFPGSYGTLQVPSSGNLPPCRQECISNWVDTNGNLWLYGGAVTSNSCYADMWKYDVATNMWTWMSGANTAGSNWGTLQVPSSTNTPGSRGAAGSWTDAQGNFWMYGGTLFSAADFGDMWKYDPITNIWTWMAGTSGYSAPCTFTIPNVAGNGVPGARFEVKSTWVDACGKLWAYGGFYYPSGTVLPWDQLWMFDPSTNLFTWVEGMNGWGGSGIHGVYQVPSTNNYPVGSGGSSAMIDSSGYVWMFGGWTISCPQGGINTLWRYEPMPDSCSLSLGISTSTQNNFIVYPNPGQGTIYVQLSENMELFGLQIQLYDVTGRCVETKKDFQTNIIELNPKAAGMYSIVLQNEQGEILGSTRIINTN